MACTYGTVSVLWQRGPDKGATGETFAVTAVANVLLWGGGGGRRRGEPNTPTIVSSPHLTLTGSLRSGVAAACLMVRAIPARPKLRLKDHLPKRAAGELVATTRQPKSSPFFAPRYTSEETAVSQSKPQQQHDPNQNRHGQQRPKRGSRPACLRAGCGWQWPWPGALGMVGDVRLTSPDATATTTAACSTRTHHSPAAPRSRFLCPHPATSIAAVSPSPPSSSCTRSVLAGGCFRFNAPRQPSLLLPPGSERLAVSYYQIAVFGVPRARSIRTALLDCPVPPARVPPRLSRVSP